MKFFIGLAFFFCQLQCKAQTENTLIPKANIRLSFLLFPFTPLFTAEIKVINSVTIQLETNFVNTQGVNLKYFIDDTFDQNYIFTGVALVKNKILRKDKHYTFLPYIGYGYAHRFGKRNSWIFDSRIGLGSTINADTNFLFPVLKTGIGKLF